MTLRWPNAWTVAVACSSVFTAMPVSFTSGQEVPKASRAETRVAQFAAHVGDLVLVGVVITADRSLALLESHEAGSGGTQVVRVGGSVSGYRLAEIQADRVTVETPRGERVVVLSRRQTCARDPCACQALTCSISRKRREYT